MVLSGEGKSLLFNHCTAAIPKIKTIPPQVDGTTGFEKLDGGVELVLMLMNVEC